MHMTQSLILHRLENTPLESRLSISWQKRSFWASAIIYRMIIVAPAPLVTIPLPFERKEMDGQP